MYYCIIPQWLYFVFACCTLIAAFWTVCFVVAIIAYICPNRREKENKAADELEYSEDGSE